MGVEYTIMCLEHKEALLIAKLGRFISYKKGNEDVCPFNISMLPDVISDNDMGILFDRTRILIYDFNDRHPRCNLSIGTELNSGDWPWDRESKYINWQTWPKIKGGYLHPSGWTIFNIYEDIDIVKLYYQKPELIENELKRGKVNLSQIFKIYSYDSITVTK